MLIVAGVWVLAQLLGGDALGRLGIFEAADKPDRASVPVPIPDDGYGPGFRDGWGRPL